MVASRLSEGQKNEIVARYRAGATSTELGKAFGCSANTVSRTLKACLEPAEYEQLKQRRGKPALAEQQAAPSAAPAPVDASAVGSPIRLPAPARAEAPAEPDAGSDPVDASATGSQPSLFDPDDDPVDGGRRRVWAIDDADDFGDDSDADDTSGDDADDADSEDDDGSETFVTVPVLALDHPPEPITCRPLAEAELPATAYLLVDKVVELLARPLREFTELGPIPQEEEERQAVSVFVNQRQAKRQCGRNQRVIPLPNPQLLLLTAPYLMAQGISRVVIDGNLYAVPEAAGHTTAAVASQPEEP